MADARHSGMWVATLSLAVLAAACESDLALDGRPCPCADGWVCCQADDVCIRPGSRPCGPASVSVGVKPKSARLRLRGSQQFVATGSVTWSVDEASGGNIDEHGFYRAPTRPGDYHVRATAQGGASATATVTVGPTELVRALGFPGGMGSANGNGQSARLGRAGSIVGDAHYFYVIDDPELEPRLDPLPVGAPVDEQPADGPRGVRRIARSTAEVSWLVDDMPLRGLTMADSKLFAGARESKALESAARKIFSINSDTGSASFMFGGNYTGAPQDGIGPGWGWSPGDSPADATFGDIAGLTADGAGHLYVTDTGPNCSFTALRRVDLWKSTVTTLATGAAWPGGTGSKPPVAMPFKCLGAVEFHKGTVYVADLGENPQKQKLWAYDPYGGTFSESLLTDNPSSNNLRAFCLDGADKIIGLWESSGEACAGELWNMHNSCGGRSIPFRSHHASPGGIECEGTWWESWGGASWGEGHGSGSFYVATAGAVVGIDRSSAGWFGMGGTVEDFAGTRAYDGSHAAGAEMRLENPSGVSSDASGNLTVFEGGNRFVRLAASGEVSALPCGPSAGDGHRNLSALSPAGDLYFLDGSTLKKVDHAASECAVLQNIGAAEGPGAVSIDLVHDGVGKLYLSSFHPPSRSVIRIDAASGAYETVLDGHSGFLATDGEKHLFVAELSDPSQKCATVISRIGLADLEPLAVPYATFSWCATALAYDPVGVLYVAEAGRNIIRALAIETGEVVDLVGDHGNEAVWLGKLPASLNRPIDIALMPDGALAIADFDEHVVLLAR